MLDLDLLRSFVSVIDAGGFTRAGERVHRTQSTVSQQIRRLEKGFGRPLLHRTENVSARLKRASGCFRMRGDSLRLPRRHRTWCRAQPGTA